MQICRAGGDPRRGGRGASVIALRPLLIPFLPGFPVRCRGPGGGGAAAPASRPTLAQALGGSGIGTRIPEAGDPKVRAATRRAVSVVPESRGADRAGLGMGEGANHPLSPGPAEPSSEGILSGTRSLPVLTWERSLRPEGAEIYMCVLSLRAPTTKRSLCPLTPQRGRIWSLCALKEGRTPCGLNRGDLCALGLARVLCPPRSDLGRSTRPDGREAALILCVI